MKKQLQTNEDLTNIVSNILQDAKSAGMTGAEVSASIDDGYNTIVRMGEVETIEYERDKDITITVYNGLKKGSASTTDTRPEALKKALSMACDIAKETGEDEYAGLPGEDLMAKDLPDLDLYHEWNITPEQSIELALDCESRARKLDKRIVNSEGVTVSNFQTKVVYGNSSNFIAEVNSTRQEVSCVLIAEHKGAMERDYSYTVARDPNDLLSIDELAKKAVEKTVMRLDPRKVKTGKTPVLFSPEMARGFLSHFVSAMSGPQLYRKSSFLLDALGKKVFSDHIHIYEDPYLLKGIGSSAFDGDGVATNKKDFIKNGFLESYALGFYGAKRLGMKTTGNAGGVHNLIIEHHDKSQQDLIKEMGTGLLVTELMGQGVNGVTGDYSRGASGFWIENGEIQYPVSEVTIAGNLKDMYQQIVAVGNDVDKRGNIQSGSILLESMMLAGG